MSVATSSPAVNLVEMASTRDRSPTIEPTDEEWVLPPTELNWKDLHSGTLSLKDSPFDASTGIADTVAQLVGERLCRTLLLMQSL